MKSMKKLIITVTVLLAFSTMSCKKAFECSCDITETEVSTAIMIEYETAVNNLNSNAEPETYPMVQTYDKTSKKSAQATCEAISEEVVTHTIKDDSNLDSDSDYDEPAYSTTTTTKRNCTLEKK